MRKLVSSSADKLRPSGIRRYFDIAATMDDVVTLGIGEPNFVTPEHITESALGSLRAGRTGYTANSGEYALREAISDYVGRLYGVEYDPHSQVLVTIGVSEALFLAMKAVLDPGDEVLVIEPCFVANSAAVEMAGGVAVMVPTYVENEFQVTAYDLETRITPRTKAILMSYPSNPTGAVLHPEYMRQVAHIAEKYDLVVISDEIYERLVYGVEHTNFASLPHMAERTILLSGLSKSFAMTGWRIGYALAPEPILSAMKKFHQYLIMSAPTMGQFAAIEALNNGEEDVAHMRHAYDKRRRLIVDGFNSLGMTCFEPRGAFYAFPSIAHTGMDDVTFCDLLLEEEHCAVIPGSAFGDSGRGFIRASYASDEANIEKALSRMARFLQRHGIRQTTLAHA
jgi:aminotransferase